MKNDRNAMEENRLNKVGGGVIGGPDGPTGIRPDGTASAPDRDERINGKKTDEQLLD